MELLIEYKNVHSDADLSVDISEFTNFVKSGSLLSGFVGNEKFLVEN